MIEVYQRDPSSHRDRLIETYESFHTMFCADGFRYGEMNYCERDVECFGTHTHMRGDTPFHRRIYKWHTCTSYLKVAYQDGKLVTPDRLLGYAREAMYYRHNISCCYRQWVGRRQGRKACAYHGYRKPKTMNERKWAIQVDGEPPIRPRRNDKNLLNSWDDVRTHNDKSWKTQTKRRRQWK